MSDDRLWHCRKLMEIFVKNCSQLAVPVGTMALDENTARTKARARARAYLPNKPDPYGIRFYSVVGWSPVYLSSMNDNRRGNYQSESGAEAYCRNFTALRTPYNTHIRNSTVIDGNSATALWILQLAHPCYQHQFEKRVVFMDNYYT